MVHKITASPIWCHDEKVVYGFNPRTITTEQEKSGCDKRSSEIVFVCCWWSCQCQPYWELKLGCWNYSDPGNEHILLLSCSS